MNAPESIELVQPVRTQTHEFRDSESKQPEVNPPQDAVLIEDVPPDGGYGWICTACVFMLNAHSWGINSVSLLSSETGSTN